MAPLSRFIMCVAVLASTASLPNDDGRGRSYTRALTTASIHNIKLPAERTGHARPCAKVNRCAGKLTRTRVLTPTPTRTHDPQLTARSTLFRWESNFPRRSCLALCRCACQKKCPLNRNITVRLADQLTNQLSDTHEHANTHARTHTYTRTRTRTHICRVQ